MNTKAMSAAGLWAILYLCVAGVLAMAGCGGEAVTPADPTARELAVVSAEGTADRAGKFRVGDVSFEPADLEKVIAELSRGFDAKNPLMKLRIIVPSQVRFGELLDLLRRISEEVPVVSIELFSKASDGKTGSAAKGENGLKWRANRPANEGASLERSISVLLSPRAEGDCLIRIDQAPGPVADLKALAPALRQLQEPTGPFHKSANVVIRPREDVAWDDVMQAMAATYSAGYDEVMLAMTPWKSSEKKPPRNPRPPTTPSKPPRGKFN